MINKNIYINCKWIKYIQEQVKNKNNNHLIENKISKNKQHNKPINLVNHTLILF